ncbi:MAG: DUF2863 family protein [Oxalicibacterium faecigallinarum]|uniref:DUF2863 family protein n=1 Tax=Oxalicibacterium faecigallinarum TaxID=573741 RepID=A0A8J3EZW9_9BURK|nr:DUF2863 family protein [Oxalicibacterium faecigallinarum]MDQ7970602.1 DUF2863 family protein [Oxalicibacterium faecigallinarum]GGI17390.1 hypothetical protein GCM10008066_08740 [Oxalicibacterium faecigallinarum]
MRRPLKNASRKLSADGHRLTMLAQAIIQASSRVEERQWEKQIETLLHKLLRTRHQETLDAALDHLFKQAPLAYDALTEAAEAASESCVIELDGVQHDALLIAVPILAWTRFSIASGSIPAEMVTTLSAHLHAHILSDHARLAMAPMLFSIDQLPRTHSDIFVLTQQMAQAALSQTPIKATLQQAETAPFLADTRYLLAVVTVASGEPMFRWQTTADLADRDAALAQWNTQALPNIARLLPGCGIELLLPEAYFVACREGDKQIRPASIRAAVHYLVHTLNIEPAALQAIIGSFGEESSEEGRVDEYRIGFAPVNQPDVLYGVIWPLYGDEEGDESEDRTDAIAAGEAPPKSPIEEIHALLEECGIIRIKRHIEQFSMEFCDDCGAPLFPDPDAELVHAEMPEEATTTEHLH